MKRVCVILTIVALSSLTFGADKTVNESARNIPVAYDVDIVVVGGSSGGVAAAVEAARNGADIFLAAPRPYLGEDLCATYRLWLKPGEEPSSQLAKDLFAEPPVAPPVGKGIPLTYEADKPSAAVHRDTPSPSLLTDGRWHSAVSQSAQYDGDVTIIADLGGEHRFEKVHVMAYQRNDDFEVESVTISISDDKQRWKQVAVIKNEELGKGSFEESAIDLSAQVKEKARYVKFSVKKGPGVSRVLLGEIVIEADRPRAETAPAVRLPPTPMQVKHTLDQALLDAGVRFLFGCYATDVLHDADGKLAGIVMVNRSGRQAVKAKVIIDAMPRADVSRIAGAAFKKYPAGPRTFKRVVVGGEAREGIRARKMPSPIHAEPVSPGAQPRNYTAIEYTLSIPMKDGSFASFAEAEQVARDRTWHLGQVSASEVLFQVPLDPMKGKKSLSGAWPGAAEVDLDVFRPADQERLYVLGGCADVSREAAEELLRPLVLLEVGTRIGQAAAAEAKRLSKPKDIRLTGTKVKPAAEGEVREILVGVRPTSEGLPTIPSDDRAIPVLGEYDVVVVGGGTGGAPAGIGAARQGAKTLVIEYLHGLGGVGTLGLIGRYYHGHREGFTAELDRGIAAMGSDSDRRINGWNVEHKMEWYRRQLREAGADIWFGTLGCGAFVEDGCVKGVVVATPQGRGVVLAKVSIDSTGSADIAITAGAEYMFTGSENAALQGTGLPPRQPEANYTNTDYTFTDETDLVDTWRTFLAARDKFKGAYDLGQIVDTRERRRIVGDFVLSPMDIANHRTFPDTVVLSRSNFDSHGYTVHPFFIIKPPDRTSLYAYTPYRSLLPKGLDGIIVTGLGISAHRDAMPILRMQACIQNQGYAMGVAASMAAKAGTATRQIDIKALQKHLVEKGNLPENVLTDKDSFPVPKEKVAAAVGSVIKDYEGLGVILAQPRDALPLLRKAYESVLETYVEDGTRPLPRFGDAEESADAPDAKLIYAHILGVMGDPTGSVTLMEAVGSNEWDEGWSFRGMGQFGPSLSPLDSLIIALGRTCDKRALKIILDKVERLGPESELSHHRALAVALETLADPVAAKPLADLLKKPGMTGHAFTDIETARRLTPAGFQNDNKTRDRTLRELILARALYRCGDHEGMGERILKEYERDLRGHLARHAHAVLKKP